MQITKEACVRVDRIYSHSNHPGKMGRMQHFVDLVRQSRLLAPNLKEMTLHMYTGDKYKANLVARELVKDHLLALRWSNPNAIIYLREHKGQGPPRVEYTLWTEPAAPKTFEIKTEVTAEEAVAKVMMAARDPDDDAVAGASAAAAAAAAGSAPAAVASAGASAGGATVASGQQARQFSTSVRQLGADTAVRGLGGQGDFVDASVTARAVR